RAPACTDAHAGMPVGRAAVEGAAAVDEHRRAPVAEEIALVFRAGSDHVARAGGEVADLAQAAVLVLLIAGQSRADLAPFVAADAAVAAGIEAQARRHVDQGAGPGIARLGAQDQSRVAAEPLEGTGARMQLGEARVRTHALDAAAQGQRPA